MTRRLVSHTTLDAALTGLARPLAAGPGLERGGEGVATEGSDAELRAYIADALSALAEEPQAPGVMVTAQHQLASLLQSHLADHPEGIGSVEAPAPDGGLEVKFDERDVAGWVRSVFEWWRRIRPEEWRPPAAGAEEIGGDDSLRLAIVGDWGTGLYGAPVIASTLAAGPDRFDLLVHLGDVYYSGTKREVERHFKALWPKAAGRLSRALNSNHEMYSGGEGLFQVTLPWFEQASTCWAAQNDHWLFVGLDTAYVDHDLAHDQDAWLTELVCHKGERRLILFSHHQPFSLLDRQGPRLVAKLGELLDGAHVFAWYWGHEHRCVIYDPHPTWEVRGRCIGHGGFPALRDRLEAYPFAGAEERWRALPSRNLAPAGRVLDMPNQYIPSDPERYGANGYVTLAIAGRSLTERVHAPDGTVVLEQMLA